MTELILPARTEFFADHCVYFIEMVRPPIHENVLQVLTVDGEIVDSNCYYIGDFTRCTDQDRAQRIA